MGKFFNRRTEKKILYEQTTAYAYFWRTAQQQEIDYVEESNGYITGYEIKWNPKAKLKAYNSFKEAYKADVKLINRENFRDFV